MDISLVKQKYDEALKGLASNTTTVFGYDKPVLIEGGAYRGVWLECGPLEGLVYGRHVRHALEIAKANHEIFFRLQRGDGYLPCAVRSDRMGTSQIQMVVPIAATALETADLTGDEAFLAQAYESCARWDHWLSRHRNTRGTGLCEAFCEYDTGHDNSPRFKNLPKKCPDNDASVCPAAGNLPYLAPDLSASVYGGRRALARMADRLGKPREVQMWLEQAEHMRERIIKHCFDPEDECFYDVDRDGNFVKIRGDALTRVLGEHVPDQALFDRIYARYIANPQEFWTPYPLPSISVSDPAFIRELPPNSWGGASQALTALRAPRWFEYYGRANDLRHLMNRWVEAILAAPGFMQQMNPWTGEFSTSEGYSPAMCVFIEFVDRLGIRTAEQSVGTWRRSAPQVQPGRTGTI
ncbi:MAG: alpha-L-rhamnosidase [Planctomycetota bacterium]